jgi:hypothetical protein
MMKWLLITAIKISCIAQLFGQSTIEINDSINERNFMPYELTYFIDTTNSLSFQEISALPFADRFQQNSSYQNKDFKTNASYWIRLPIRHTAHTEKVWLLEFYDQTIDYLDAFIPQSNGSYEKIAMGDKLPFSQRSLMHKNFEIVLDMKTDTLVYYYFRVESHGFGICAKIAL